MLRTARRALGLITAGVFLIATGSLWAQTTSVPLRSCSKIADDAARLACFDREIARTLAADSAVQDSATPPSSPEAKLGLSAHRLQQLEAKDSLQPPKISELQAHIVRTTAGSFGHDVFELDNGQVWQQTEEQTSFMARPGDEVTVKKGALGSFWLSCGPRQATRVKRLR